MQTTPNSWVLRIKYSDRPGGTPHIFVSETRLMAQIAELIAKGKQFSVEALSR